ncbi:MAG: carbonic anhydrase family protein [Bacteroidales bacterium]|nr:carbonic anhydrase family protein [Bacteroidales bacterium]
MENGLTWLKDNLVKTLRSSSFALDENKSSTSGIYKHAVMETKENEVNSESGNPGKILKTVISAEERDKLTPDLILQDFLDGNERFRNNSLTQRDHSAQIRKSAFGQYPKAVVVSCLDSRVPVEDVFDQGIGDVFVGRIAGNFVNDDLLGSLEFACKVAGAKLIVIMGHQHCGAIIGAINDVKLGNLTTTLSKIKPAIKMSQDYSGEKTSRNEEFVKLVSVNNIRHAISTIRTKSPILREMEENGEIKIVGLFYTLTKGELLLID